MTFISKLSALAVIGVLFAALPAMAQAVPGHEGGPDAAQGPREGSAAGTNANSNPSGSNKDMGKTSMGQTSNAGSTSATNSQSTAGNTGGQSKSGNHY